MKPRLAPLALCLAAACTPAHNRPDPTLPTAASAPAPAPASAGPPGAPPRQTFHYAKDSKPAKLGEELTGAIDPQTLNHFAEGFRFDCPGPGSLRVRSEVEPAETELRVAVFAGGKKPLAQGNAPSPVVAPVEKAGPCYVVIAAPVWSWDCTYRVTVTFEEEKR